MTTAEPIPRPTAADRAGAQALARHQHALEEAAERRAKANADLAEKDKAEAADAEAKIAQARARFAQLTSERTPTRAPSPAETEAAREQARGAAILAEWEAMVPPLYRDTDLADARIHPSVRAAGAMWDCHGRRGLAFVGRSGLGKSRVMTMLLLRAIDAGRSVQWVSHVDLAEAGILASKPGTAAKVATAARELIDRCKRRSVLYIDDVGKGATSEKALAALANVAEFRVARYLPILWSAESGGKWLAARLGDNRGDSTIRRLGTEFCDAPDLPRAPLPTSQAHE